MTHIEIALANPQGTETPTVELRIFPLDSVTFAKLENGRCRVLAAARGFASAGTVIETFETYETVASRLSSSPSGNVARVSPTDLTSATALRTADVAEAESL